MATSSPRTCRLGPESLSQREAYVPASLTTSDEQGAACERSEHVVVVVNEQSAC